MKRGTSAYGNAGVSALKAFSASAIRETRVADGQIATRALVAPRPAAVARASPRDAESPFIFQFPAIRGMGAVIKASLLSCSWGE